MSLFRAIDDSRVLSSTREDRPQGVAVYNFEVEGDHTYFVEDGLGAATAVWVHNACKINHHDVVRYGDFNATINKRDKLAGHEILQNAWLEKAGKSNRNNPAIALTNREHKIVTIAQQLAGLHQPTVIAKMSRVANIRANMQIMEALGDTLNLSASQLRTLHVAVVRFARTLR